MASIAEKKVILSLSDGASVNLNKPIDIPKSVTDITQITEPGWYHGKFIFHTEGLITDDGSDIDCNLIMYTISMYLSLRQVTISLVLLDICFMVWLIQAVLPLLLIGRLYRRLLLTFSQALLLIKHYLLIRVVFSTIQSKTSPLSLLEILLPVLIPSLLVNFILSMSEG